MLLATVESGFHTQYRAPLASPFEVQILSVQLASVDLDKSHYATGVIQTDGNLGPEDVLLCHNVYTHTLRWAVVMVGSPVYVV